ncbi:uncharacterized protein CCOS01_11587 [Colletotrichum costaricense]|uniref:Uncharacterized protein n=1 Tax=Colletotrichum costaricense TaxID=1209916 RepID=A0AAI9YQ21_9PEZI|nr:uncharacterized protein CCOS01_11587 [Colletotrichum costaricense]KAK1518767.1 hypothetical protein CCOS01_11587 [Colletotrichum costaricense]
MRDLRHGREELLHSELEPWVPGPPNHEPPNHEPPNHDPPGASGFRIGSASTSQSERNPARSCQARAEGALPHQALRIKVRRTPVTCFTSGRPRVSDGAALVQTFALISGRCDAFASKDEAKLLTLAILPTFAFYSQTPRYK